MSIKYDFYDLMVPAIDRCFSANFEEFIFPQDVEEMEEELYSLCYDYITAKGEMYCRLAQLAKSNMDKE